MDVEFAEPTPHPIQGQLLRLSERREVAIYLRDGALWVADFIDGFGTLADAATWFRFSCASSASWHLRRRMALESAMPLSSALIARSPRVRRFHRAATATRFRFANRDRWGFAHNRARRHGNSLARPRPAKA